MNDARCSLDPVGGVVQDMPTPQSRTRRCRVPQKENLDNQSPKSRFWFTSGNLSVVFASVWTRGMAERGVFETDIGNF